MPKGAAITAAPSRARGGRGTLVPAKLERGGRDNGRERSPRPGADCWEEIEAAGTKLGRAQSLRLPASTGGSLAASEGMRDAWAENSPAAEPGSAEAASCAAHPPARRLLLLSPGVRSHRAPGSRSSRSAAPRGWKAPVAPTHLWVGDARIPPPSPPLCASLIPSRPLSPSPTPPRSPPLPPPQRTQVRDGGPGHPRRSAGRPPRAPGSPRPPGSRLPPGCPEEPRG